MEIKKVEKAYKVVEQIKAIDKEVLELEKMVMLITNNPIEASFEVTVKDLSKTEEVDKQSGSIGFMMGTAIRLKVNDDGTLSTVPEKEQRHPIHNIKAELPSGLSLQVIGYLLLKKQAQREALLKQVEQITWTN
jgi:hypothetical protein